MKLDSEMNEHKPLRFALNLETYTSFTPLPILITECQYRPTHDVGLLCAIFR